MHIHKLYLIIYELRKLSKLKFPPFLENKCTALTLRTIYASERVSLGHSLYATSSRPWPLWEEDFCVTSCKWALLKEGTGELKQCQLSTT